MIVAYLFSLFTAVASDGRLEQVLLHWGANNASLVVSWGVAVSVNDDVAVGEAAAELVFGTSASSLEQRATAYSVPFSCRRKPTASPKYALSLFGAEMPAPEDKPVYYQVSVGNAKSEIFRVNPMAAVPRYAVFGDFGIKQDVSMQKLADDAERGVIDAVLHAGDIAYNLDTESGTVGNAFMEALTPTSARVPYMAVVGNHEACHTCGYNFSDFQHRFHGLGAVAAASSSRSMLYFSYDVPLIHFVFLNTEAWLGKEPSDQVGPMLDWLETDLKKANEPANRRERPWIITIGHKGWYMDEFDGRFDVMNLLHKYGVDAHFCGHQHDYERYLPLHVPKEGCKPYVEQQPKDTYTDPQYMVTIVAGSPGNQEQHGGGGKPPPTGLPDGTLQVFYDPSHFGYGYLRAHNATHLEWVWDEVHNLTEVPRDTLWIVQHSHLERKELPCNDRLEDIVV